MLPEATPNWVGYPVVGKPVFFVLDGKGTIRRIIKGYSMDMQFQIVRTVQFLLREAATTASPAPELPR
jgi:hypothetical protein